MGAVETNPNYEGPATTDATEMSAKEGSVFVYGGFVGTVALQKRDPDGGWHNLISVGAHNAAELADGGDIRFDFRDIETIRVDPANVSSGTASVRMIATRPK